MGWTSWIAIYGLFWVLSAFLVMPFGIRTNDEVGIETGHGHADSAPANFNPRKIMLRATMLAAVLCGLYYANFVNGWIAPEDINIFGRPPNFDGTPVK